MHRKATSLRVPAGSGQGSALTEFHALAGHPGPAERCQDCAGQLERQRHAAAALRSHQRQTRQQVDVLIDEDPGDEQLDLRLEEAAFDPGMDDEPELWGEG